MRPIALLTLFLAPTVLACDLNVRAHTTELPSSIEWDRYIGALSYLVTESSDGFVTSKTYEVPATTFTIPHRVSEVTKYSYRVEARFEPDQVIDGSCRGSVELALKPDPQFRAMTRKVVVPIVVGLALVGWFIRHALHVPKPLLNIRLYYKATFSSASIAMFCIGAALFGGMILLPYYWQTIRHESVVTALLGAAFGIPLGVLFALVVGAAIKYSAFTIPWATLVVFIFAAVVAGIIAAIFPARRAAKLNVLQALQYE